MWLNFKAYLPILSRTSHWPTMSKFLGNSSNTAIEWLKILKAQVGAVWFHYIKSWHHREPRGSPCSVSDNFFAQHMLATLPFHYPPYAQTQKNKRIIKLSKFQCGFGSKSLSFFYFLVYFQWINKKTKIQTHLIRTYWGSKYLYFYLLRLYIFFICLCTVF